ncbi:MAG: Carbon monoxide dehydrogenase medium chain [Alphaproteobacteria bacterium MarineAlpha11_Bin1]|nr:MAG: Carbon monoxide dehydrogenase medium chain [Alphaproteobacteria bacterium MarineAlpha11_Bin1]
MKAPKFSYVRAESVGHALELLDQHGDDARILAGGQSLMPTLNMRLSQPEILVDINRLQELKGITLDGDTVTIGALTRHVEVMNSEIVSKHLPLIAEAMPHVAHVAIRNRGTIGGSIALSDPAAEMPACALALGASLVVQSSEGKREIPAEEFFHGLYETARAENELLIEIRFPIQKKGNVSVFMELARRHGDFAIAGICAYGKVSGNTIDDMRLVYFASEDRPMIGENAIAALNGKTWSEDTKDAVSSALENDLDPMANLHGSSAMKMHLQKVLTGRAMDTAISRAGNF